MKRVPEAAHVGLRQVARADLDDRTIAHRVEDFEHHGTVLHLNLLALIRGFGRLFESLMHLWCAAQRQYRRSVARKLFAISDRCHRSR